MPIFKKCVVLFEKLLLFYPEKQLCPAISVAQKMPTFGENELFHKTDYFKSNKSFEIELEKYCLCFASYVMNCTISHLKQRN